MRSDYTQAYINRGDVMMRLGRPRDAQAQYETALQYEPDNADLYYNLGVVHLGLDEQQVALKLVILMCVLCYVFSHKTSGSTVVCV